MKKIFAAAVLSLFAVTARAQVVVKLGTLAPSGSTWHNLLKEMAEKWSEASNGRVQLKIYPGGALGNEGDMVRKMAVNQLQAASITAVGMHDITPEPQAVSAPMMIEDDAEFADVFPRVQAQLEQELANRGYVVLQWAQVGYVHFFCSKPYHSWDEMKGAKVFAWDGDPASVQAWKAAGFEPVVLSSTDMMPSLQTGMITCLADPPLYVYTARLFEKANHMVDVNWGMLIGATLVKKATWEKIPADLRPKLMQIARDLGQRTDAEVTRMNAEAMAQMKKQGLDVITVDAAPFRASAERSWTVVRGKVVPAAIFDEVKKYRDAWRASHP